MVSPAAIDHEVQRAREAAEQRKRGFGEFHSGINNPVCTDCEVYYTDDSFGWFGADGW